MALARPLYAKIAAPLPLAPQFHSRTDKSVARKKQAPEKQPGSTLRTTATDDSSDSSNDEASLTRVALWNTVYQRKICGASAPLARNLEKYLVKHLDCEVYCGHDKLPENLTSQGAPRLDRREAAPNMQPLRKRVTIWHKVQNRKVVRDFVGDAGMDGRPVYYVFVVYWI